MKIRMTILLGIAGLLLLGLACTVEEPTSVTSSTTAVVEDVAEVEVVATVVPEGCFLTGSCPLQNGWTLDDWATVAAILIEVGVAEDMAACTTDAVMLRYDLGAFLALTDNEYEALGLDVTLNECLPLLVD